MIKTAFIPGLSSFSTCRTPSQPLKRRRTCCCHPPDRSEDPDPAVSRRVFLLGTAATTALTAAVGYRFVIGEDIESRVKLRFTQAFPGLFPPETTPEERRKALDGNFARAYFNAVGEVATEMKLCTERELQTDELAVREQARGLFFDGDISETFANSNWLNFLLYARLHVIAKRTSPKQRLEFAQQLARRTLGPLRVQGIKFSKDEARKDPQKFLGAAESLLQQLVDVGWISGWKLEGFDNAEWEEEGRGTLTVFAMDVVTMQAAMLMGEEQFEEISPKVSPWVREVIGVKSSVEDYYMDSKYRPDPVQFQPTQIASQFDLSV